MTTILRMQSNVQFLDVGAYLGISKHSGGRRATDELIHLCHIQEGQVVLYPGCGIGVGPAYLARKYNCQVVGVDTSAEMIEWANQRIREEGVEDRVELRQADVMALPYQYKHFDAVICESVLGFVEDKRRALRELVRVVKPGGYVGFNETFWISHPSVKTIQQLHEMTTSEIPCQGTWEQTWEESVLEEHMARCYLQERRSEFWDDLQWVGWWRALRSFARLLGVYLLDATARKAIKDQLIAPLVATTQMGYVLFAGRKPIS